MVLFVAELRKLFALMLKSRRRTINPSPTLLCLRNCSKYDVEMFNQEDVSEFATILVNLLEESFDVITKLNTQQQQQTQIRPLQPSNVVELPIHRVSSTGGDSSAPVVGSEIKSKQADADDADVLTDLHLANLLTDKLNIRKNRKNPIVNLLNGDILITRKSTGNNLTTCLDVGLLSLLNQLIFAILI